MECRGQKKVSEGMGGNSSWWRAMYRCCSLPCASAHDCANSCLPSEGKLMRSVSHQRGCNARVQCLEDDASYWLCYAAAALPQHCCLQLPCFLPSAVLSNLQEEMKVATASGRSGCCSILCGISHSSGLLGFLQHKVVVTACNRQDGG